ncbi:MAG TPA: DinB family protein [Gemmatimonadales bacterium]|nr:DinB family protein [Gemmatimonadales bacterium]
MAGKTVVLALLLLPSAAGAQAVATLNPLYRQARTFIVKSAEMMPEENYSFKPVPTVRSFGEIVGHLANENLQMCAAAKGEKRDMVQDFEKTTEKAALVKALKDAVAYCDPLYAMADKDFAGDTELFGMKMTRLGVLALNVTHDFEHYGNFITYLRIKGLVPPSSQGPGM